MRHAECYVTLLFAMSSALSISTNPSPEKATERQKDMIKQYINAAFIPRLVTEREVYRLFIKGSMSSILGDLYQRVTNIVRCCSSQPANLLKEQAENFCKLVPCGKLVVISTGIFHREWTVRVPQHLSINVTVLEVSSQWKGFFCLFSASLRFPKHGRNNPVTDRSPSTTEGHICGKSPAQVFFLRNNEQRIIWESTEEIRNKVSFSLSYQAVARDYVQIHPVNATTKLCVYQSLANCHNYQRLRESDLSLFKSLGDTAIYAWFITGSILKIPIIEIHLFNCMTSGPAPAQFSTRLASLTLYDVPLFPRDPANMIMKPFMKALHLCSRKPFAQVYTSSVGDFTLLAAVQRSTSIVLIATVTLLSALSKCSKFCNKTVIEVSQYEAINFSMLSMGTSQQQMMLSPSSPHLYLIISDLTVQFEGYSHFRCTVGGIYIYELTPLRLIGKLCSPLAAKIWSGAVEQADGTVKLYLNKRKVLIIMKTYMGLSTALVSGTATLQDGCIGFVNPAQTIRRQTYSYRSKDCEIQQYLNSEDANVDRRTSIMSINIKTTDFLRGSKDSEAECTIRGSRNQTGFPTKPSQWMWQESLYRPCIYKIYRAGNDQHLYNFIDHRYESFSVTFRPKVVIKVVFDTLCLITGFQTVLSMSKVPVNTTCMPSNEIRQQISLRFNDEAENILPPVFCGLLEISNSDLAGPPVFGITFSRFQTRVICCILAASLTANPPFYVLHEVTVWEETIEDITKLQQKIRIPQRWYLLRDSNHTGEPATAKPSTSKAETVIQQRFVFNVLHGDVHTQILFKRLATCRFDTKCEHPALELHYRYSFHKSPSNIFVSDFIARKRAWTKDCSSIELAQYCFELHRNISWIDTMEYCSSLGLQLLVTPSDSEWHVIQDLFSLDGSAKILSESALLFFLGLKAGVVSHPTSHACSTSSPKHHGINLAY